VLEGGTNAQTFDTADTYSQGHSERILGKFIKKYDIPRESVVIMTKTFFEWGDAKAHGPAGFVNNARLSRKVRITLCIVYADVTEDLRCCQRQL